MITKQSDAGRSETGLNETNDCTVVALAHAASLTYKEAHELARKAGRRHRHGLKPTNVANMLTLASDYLAGRATVIKVHVTPATRDLNPNLPSVQAYKMYGRRPRRKGTTVAAFLRTLPKQGRFYLACTSHAFAYIDGVVIDNLNRPMTRATMQMAYEVVPVAATSVVAPTASPIAAPITQDQVNELWARLDKLERKGR